MMLKVRFVFNAAIFLSVFLLAAGCSNDKNINIEKLNKSEPRILLSNSSFVQESENMVYLADAIQRNDADYLQQLIVENKVFVVDKDTKVDCFISDTNSNNAEIIFKEGRYTTKKGITLKNFLITEEEYPAYIAEKERQESRKANINYIFEVIHKSTTLVSYMETDNVYLIKQFLSDMKKYKRKLDELSNDANLDSDIRDMAKKASTIIEKNGEIAYNNIQYLESSDTIYKIHFLELGQQASTEYLNLIKNFAKEYGF